MSLFRKFPSLLRLGCNLRPCVAGFKSKSRNSYLKPQKLDNKELGHLYDYLGKNIRLRSPNIGAYMHLHSIASAKVSSEFLLESQENLIKLANHSSIEELAIISLAYFRTQTRMENPELIKTIISRLKETLPSIDPTTPVFCSVVKNIRYSVPKPLELQDDVEDLARTILGYPHLKKILTENYMNAMQMLKLMEAYRVRDEDYMNFMANSMIEQSDNLRVKDIQYTLTSLSNLAYNDLNLDEKFKAYLDKLCHKIVGQQLQGSDELYAFYHILPMLRALTILGYYNDQFIEYVFDQARKNQHELSKVFNYQQSLLLLHSAISLLHRPDLDLALNFIKCIDDRFGRPRNYGLVSENLFHDNFRLLEWDPVKHRKSFASSATIREVAKKLYNSRLSSHPDTTMRYQVTMPFTNYSDVMISRDCKESLDYDRETLLPKPVPAGQKCCILIKMSDTDYMGRAGVFCGHKRLLTDMYHKLGYRLAVIDGDNIDEEKLTADVERCLVDENHKGIA